MGVSLSGLVGREWIPSPVKRVDIVALGESCLEFVQGNYHAPAREAGHEVWTMNSGHLSFFCDKVWNMHDLRKLAQVGGETDYIPQYANLKQDLITIRALEEIPTSLEFPIGLAIKQFSTNYFANTVSYMVAGALLCGAEEIAIYGADYNYPNRSAYEAGRACVEYWLGYAHAKGVKIKTAYTSTLLDLCHRIPGMGGAIKYGEVYGYFDEQPEYDATGTVTGFKRPKDADAQ